MVDVPGRLGELPARPAIRAVRAADVQHADHLTPDRCRHDPLLLDGRVLAGEGAVAWANLAILFTAGDDDPARSGDDDSDIHDIQVAGLDRNAAAAYRAVVLRVGIQHLSAAAVLYDNSGGTVRRRAFGRLLRLRSEERRVGKECRARWWRE